MALRRNIKIQEFDVVTGSQGSSRITCAQLGHKSHTVIVAGDDARNVRLWKVSKQYSLLNFQGHSSDITTVAFGYSEEEVYSGSYGGTVMVWDLNSQKAVSSLKGHLAACTTIGTFPNRQQTYIATGSTDCAVKVWDLRQKFCILTFKGHKESVNCVQFSPDHNWLASGGGDGIVKIWDLKTNKKITDMNVGVSPVTCMQFNPENLTLASGHADRTAKLWDLETFGFVSSTLPDAMPPQQICWIPQNGTDLFTASNDSLKLWNIEKALLKDSIESSWKGVMDISVYGKENALLGLCVNGPTFTLWSTDLKTVNFDENTSREPEEQKVNPAQARTRKKDKPDFNVSFVTCNVNAPTGTDLSELCVTHKISPLGPDPEELKVLQDIDEGHAQLINVMKNRTKNIHSVQKYYENGNMTAALNALNMMKDIPAITDTLNSCLVTYKSDAISLEHCSLIIPLAKKLMESRYESHVRIGIRSCEELINMFGGVITSTLTSSTNIGVDLSREERIKKCQAILECFRQLQESECIPKCVSRKGQVGTMASSLMESLNKLVSLFNR
jgi:hypothetical protein